MRMLFGTAVVAVWVAVAAAAVSAQVVLPPTMGVPDAAPTVPGPGHDLALTALAAGDYAGALDVAEREYRGSSKVGADRWIDSIASAAVLGEALYELGRLSEALARYEESLTLAAVHGNWLLSVRFPPQPLGPLRGARPATWGRSKRNTTPAAIPGTMTIREQGADPQEVLQKGGKLTAPYERPIRPQEIIRLLVIATYRTGSLLGELAAENNPLDRAARSLARRAAPQGHYSQSWIDIALGTAAWARGRPREAEPLLIRGLMVGNQFDHPLTPWGLIVLGRITQDGGNAAQAAELFEEATYAAAAYGDARALEEAFLLAWKAHRLAGRRGVPPTIARAAEATRRGPAALRARLLAMQAVSLAAAGDARAADAAVASIDQRLLGGQAGQGTLGGLAAYAEALAASARGDLAAGDEPLGRALGIARQRSPQLFRTNLVVGFVRGGSANIGARQAEEWLANWLADPTPRDFAADPLETLAVITAPRQQAFDTWVAVACQRRRHELILDAAEATMRQRWIASRPLGGRREAIERFLLAAPETLGDAAAARQRALINGRPGLGDLLVGLQQAQGNLAAAVAAAAGGPLPGEAAEWRAYAEAAGRLRQVTAFLAASGEADGPLFPPLTPTEEICRRLEPGQAILSFHWTEAGLIGALESRERQLTWQVKQAAGLPDELKVLAQSLSLRERAAVVGSDRLVGGDWRGSAERIERMLFENSGGVSLTDGIEELIVVPDGWLWYLPFEILQVASNQAGDRRPLGDLCLMRYAPTRSLAVLEFEPRAGGATGLLVGESFRGQSREAAAAAAAEVAAGLERATTLELAAAGPPPPLVGSLFDTLVVLDELPAPADGESQPLLVTGKGRGGMTFADWLRSPPKRPWQVILPGLQTAMAGGLARPPERAGEDVFLAATDLLAAGARTAVISRWRSLGKTGEAVLQEYLRETAGPGGIPPAEAWRRAVGIATAERPDLLREPRIKQADDAYLDDSRHPLLWAGLLLVDCGGGVHQPAAAVGPRPRPPLAPAGPPLAPAAPPQADAPGPVRPAAPMPPAILPPPPPRPPEGEARPAAEPAGEPAAGPDARPPAGDDPVAGR